MRARRRGCAALALLVLWQALALSFHLATERHLAVGDLLAVVDVPQAEAEAVPQAGDGPQVGDGPQAGDGTGEHPHAPHAAIDHQVAQDRADDDLQLLPTSWLPMVVAVTVPRDCVGVSAGAPPTGPPPARRQRASIAARAPPLA